MPKLLLLANKKLMDQSNTAIIEETKKIVKKKQTKKTFSGARFPFYFCSILIFSFSDLYKVYQFKGEKIYKLKSKAIQQNQEKKR